MAKLLFWLNLKENYKNWKKKCITVTGKLKNVKNVIGTAREQKLKHFFSREK